MCFQEVTSPGPRLCRAKAEELAKAQYASTRDPAACALLYAALGKKSLLQGTSLVSGAHCRQLDCQDAFLPVQLADSERLGKTRRRHLGKTTPCAACTGLFRVVANKRLSDFMARDFRDPPHAAAAAKNAFVLLGQHKPHLAAAFFLLGEPNPCHSLPHSISIEGTDLSARSV